MSRKNQNAFKGKQKTIFYEDKDKTYKTLYDKENGRSTLGDLTSELRGKAKGNVMGYIDALFFNSTNSMIALDSEIVNTLVGYIRKDVDSLSEDKKIRILKNSLIRWEIPYVITSEKHGYFICKDNYLTLQNEQINDILSFTYSKGGKLFNKKRQELFTLLPHIKGNLSLAKEIYKREEIPFIITWNKDGIVVLDKHDSNLSFDDIAKSYKAYSIQHSKK